MTCAQDQNKYVHLLGYIDSEEKVSADLIFAGQKVYGFIHNHFTGDIPLELSGTLLEDGKIVLAEVHTDETIIEAKLLDEVTLSGTWKNETGELRPFEMSVRFLEGSRQFRVTAVSSLQPLYDQPDSPVAVYESVILSASGDTDKTSAEKLMTMIYKDLFRLSTQTDALIMLKDQETKFFEQYRSNNLDINTKENYQYLNWEKRKLLSVIYNDKDLLSLKLHDYAYTGGTSGLSISRYLVYDFVTGKKIAPSNLFLPESESRLSKLIRSSICSKLNIDPDFSLSDYGFFSNEIPVSQNFFITSSGVGFHYNTYELAGQETGPLSVFISFEQIKELVNPESQILRVSF
ncbi:MAG: DUF3298 and DUF4163 domain-containing protein [Lentimicrobium sp.]|nr:DUF3298 and DUF4163 domain-containing protein [Lentimicrobium sp.]